MTRIQVQISPAVRLSLKTRPGASTYGIFELHSSFDDRDEEQSLRDHLANHEALLRAGWHPVKWTHPELGELELVVSDDFWIATTPSGVRTYVNSSTRTVERIQAAVAAGRTKFRRDVDGNLQLVVAVDK